MKFRLAALVVLVACKGADAPTTANAGEACAIGGRTTHGCRDGLTCKETPYTAPPATSGQVRGPENPSDVGGACGGVAGFHCADGLACDMSPEQSAAADGMGTCARTSTCR